MGTSISTRKFVLCTGERVQADQLNNYPDSHIIGELRFVLYDGQKVIALAVYEISLPSNLTPPIQPDIRAEIVGDARRIRCTISHCEHFKNWAIGRTAFLRLSQRHKLYFEQGE